MGSLGGRVAWITGGGTGIGAAAAAALVEAGGTVIISGRRRRPLEEVARRIGRSPGRVEVAPVDVTDSAAVERAAAEISEKYGPVDILVNSAGINIDARYFRMVSPEGWRSVVDTNLNGTFYCIHAVLPSMRERGGGLIINISSWVGRYNPTLGGPAYPSTKRALLAMTEALNLEENINGIRGCCIAPAEVDTELLDRRPVPPSQEARMHMLRSEDLGSLIRYIAELPSTVCINEVVISPTWNHFHISAP